MFGEETPRKGPVSYIIEMEREREREMLEALRFVIGSVEHLHYY